MGCLTRNTCKYEKFIIPGMGNVRLLLRHDCPLSRARNPVAICVGNVLISAALFKVVAASVHVSDFVWGDGDLAILANEPVGMAMACNVQVCLKWHLMKILIEVFYILIDKLTAPQAPPRCFEVTNRAKSAVCLRPSALPETTLMKDIKVVYEN